MNPDQPDQPQDYSQPVAYDRNGQPLYAHPPTVAAPTQSPSPQVVHMSRAVEPVQPEISSDVKARHNESVRLYPFLNLSDAEYIISAVRRHAIGLFAPVAVCTLLIVIFLSLLFYYDAILASIGLTGSFPSVRAAFFPIVMLIIAVIIGGLVSVYVYMSNRFFLTNESVIQEIQVSLFSHYEQTVSLLNIEDASFSQKGILQNLLNYGDIRLSTEGDETTYRFQYVSNPKAQIAKLNNAVEAFKNGRPVEN
jgi:hypothetical protein